jgi:hypothetical protein
MRSQAVELHCCSFRLGQGTAQQRRASQRSFYPFVVVPGPFGILLGGGLMVPAGFHRFDGRIAGAHAHQAGIREQLSQSIDHRFEHSSEKTDGQSIHGPQHAHQLEHPCISRGECQEEGHDSTKEGNGADSYLDEAKRLLGPALCSRTGGERIVRVIKGRSAQGKKLGNVKQPSKLGALESVDFRCGRGLNPGTAVRPYDAPWRIIVPEPVSRLTSLTSGLAALLLCVSLAARLGAQTPDSTSTSVPWRTSYFPYITGGSNDNPVLAFRVRYWQPAEYEARVTTSGALTLDAGITSRGSRFAKLQFKAPQLWKDWRINTFVGAIREARYGYFGLGNDTDYNKDLVTKADPFIYRVRRTRYRGLLELSHAIGRNLQVALLGDLERARFTTLPGPSIFQSDFGNELKQTDLSGRVALVYDTRDNEYNTHQGVLLEVGTQVGSGGDGYTRLYTVLRGYLPIREGTVVAARIAASGMGGTPSLDARYTIPAWENWIPVLGGQYSHRSLDVGRLAGRHVLLGNLEVRHDLLPFGDLGAITLIGFVDAGRVFEGENFALTTKQLKVGGGGGVALRILRSSIITFNFAGGPDGFKFSLGTGWMF